VTAAVIETGNRRKVETMEMKGEGEESGVKVKRETEVVMDFMRDGGVKRIRIGPEQGLEGEPRTNTGNQALSDNPTKKGEGEFLAQVRKLKVVNQVTNAKKLLVRIIGGHTKKLHMASHYCDRLINDGVRPQISWIH
jgi:hypothetical protein